MITKIQKYFFIMILCILGCSLLCSCSKNEESVDESVETKSNTTISYFIQYSDENGVHQVEVLQGGLYSISPIPQKAGYDFMGLFDSESGGTRYVNANGSAIASFTDNRNLVLYPQFKAKEYTLVLDYQGANVTGARSFNVSYGSSINNLPTNLELENKNFVGWFTEPNKKGIQIADQYGIIPNKSIISEDIFDLSDKNGFIIIYAGFKFDEYIVTLYFDNDVPEEIAVEYGTYVSDIETERRVDGKAVISWSTKKNDIQKENVFSGKITGGKILYACEYAPIIEFNVNGGNKVASIVKRAGDAISLPTPTRNNYKFIGWITGDDDLFNSSVMPSESQTLTAKWQAMIIFDENGGTAVADICEPQGTEIILPTTEKAGFIFAGWYNGNKKFESMTMPSESIILIAKYYNIVTKIYVIVDSTRSVDADRRETPSITSSFNVLDLSELYNMGIRHINVTAHYQSKYSFGYSQEGPAYTYMNWYTEESTSDAYCVWKLSDKHMHSNTWGSNEYNNTISLTTNKIYICRFISKTFNGDGYWTDFWVEIEYPDMSNLY